MLFWTNHFLHTDRIDPDKPRWLLYKTKMIGPRVPWKNLDEVEYATLEWVNWYNNQRLLEPIGNIPPVEFEEAYYEQENAQAMAA